MNTINDISIIDVSPLLNNPDRDQCRNTVKEVRKACEETGVLYVTGQGIEEEQIREVLLQARLFFQSSLDDKQKIDISASNHYRGYVGYKQETTKGKIDLHEALDLGRDIPSNHPDTAKFPLFGPNQWPQHLQVFKKTITEYFEKMSEVGKAIGRGIFYSLGASDKFIDALQKDRVDLLRLLYYPNQEAGQGIGEHIDYGVATLIAQDATGGLEVKKADGEWTEAVPVEGALPVVIGKMIQVTSNDLYRATVHRVHATTGKERFSAPFFHGPNFDSVIQPLDMLCTDDYPAKYQPYHYGQSVLTSLKKSYGY